MYKLEWAVRTNWHAAHTPSTVHRLVTNYAPSSSDGGQSPRERAIERRHAPATRQAAQLTEPSSGPAAARLPTGDDAWRAHSP